MRHRVKLNHLGRKTAHRKALLSHLACDLIRHKRIITTLAKAKALRVYVEPLITKSKTNTTHQRRIVFSYLQDKEAVTELFSDISAKIGSRPGGYTRIIKLGARLGDAAEMAMIELVDYNEIYSSEPADAGKKKRTRRGGSRSRKSTSAGSEGAAEKAKDAPATEAAEKQPEEAAAKAEKKPVADKKATKEEDTGEEKTAAKKEAAPTAASEKEAAQKTAPKEKETEAKKETAPKSEKPEAPAKDTKKETGDKENKKPQE